MGGSSKSWVPAFAGTSDVGTSQLRNPRIRVGIVGVGNCASSFVQGLTYYRAAQGNAPIPGLTQIDIGGYRISDIALSSAFDVNAAKVGRDVAEAIAAPPNNTAGFADVEPTGVTVRRGPTLDGLGHYLKQDIEESPAPDVDVREALVESGTDVVVCYLPVGSQRATEHYAEQALGAGCAFVNCIPVFIASDPGWRRRFEERGLPIIGDDIKSQVGATIVHRMFASISRWGCCARMGRTCRGWATANGPTSAWKAPRSGACRSTSNSSSRRPRSLPRSAAR